MKKTIATLTAMLFATSSFAAEFSTMDANADGVISEVEFVAAYPQANEAQLAAADLDKSGSLDEAEVAAAVAAGVLPAE
jgi:hypothetical protein